MHKCIENLTIIRNNSLIKGCELCINSQVKGAEFAQKNNREWQRGQYRKDLIQPNQPKDFVRAHGAKRAIENGYSEEQVRKYS